MSQVIDRVRGLSGRAKVFIALGVILLALGFSGALRANSDVVLPEAQAVEIGRAHIDFEPTNADARLVRQGFNLAPVWAVSYSIPSEDSSREFVRLTTVEIHASTGNVIRVSVDGLDRE